MQVQLALFAHFSGFQPDGRGGRSSRPLELPDDSTVADVVELIGLPAQPRIAFINGVHAHDETPLCEGDRLAIFPPVAGGAESMTRMPAAGANQLDPLDDAALRARLAESHVALIGCGGLGSNAAAMLVRSGVGTLTLIDFDVIEESNLNRQMFFRDQLGRPKTEALAETLRRIKPDIDLRLIQERMTEENLVAALGGADVVIEAVDQAETKALIANVLLGGAVDVPLVSASGLAGFESANDVIAERITENFYLIGDCRSDVRLGLPLFASRVMVAAAHQAHVAIRILLGHDEP